jgi:lysophospholipid acyltransferase (LPLAT)-like uncharacterized protein
MPAYLFIVFLKITLKIKFIGNENIEQFVSKGKNYILCFWHGSLLLMIYAFKGEKRTFLVSFHRDGELITKVIKRFGVEATRGSSSKGGTKALLSLLRKAKSGYSIAFTPDGPKGPARKAQSGVVELARLSNLPIIPVGFYAKKFKKMNSWDSFLVPYPFTKAAFCYGEPIYVKEKGVNYIAKIEESLNEAEKRAQESVIKD